ncbi:hypothetical protein HYH02_003551 [Chlamydomonas schloesseri]|uniref:Uncharacterized protein n=1 Tax=Chlamydomonas schloesseri TaxID=2026947 RepID=A0A835WQS6_9CHLO|nr:hypothetical protein HYH02_003551 [Chlamydomonas schloesseri]|eukprot:KAG2451772.1 hypothetical protein HYH02_003551 [Chlamydomonas schloesseri]
MPHPPPGPGLTSSPPLHRRGGGGNTASWQRAVQAVAVYAPQMAGPLLAGRYPGPHASSSWSHAHGHASGHGHGGHGGSSHGGHVGNSHGGQGHGHSVSAGGAHAPVKKGSNLSAAGAANGPGGGTPRAAPLPRLIPRGVASSGGASVEGLRLVTSSLDSLPPLIRSAEEGSSRARLGGGAQSTERADRRRHSDALGDARYYSYNGER